MAEPKVKTAEELQLEVLAYLKGTFLFTRLIYATLVALTAVVVAAAATFLLAPNAFVVGAALAVAAVGTWGLIVFTALSGTYKFK